LKISGCGEFNQYLIKAKKYPTSGRDNNLGLVGVLSSRPLTGGEILDPDPFPAGSGPGRPSGSHSDIRHEL
jgi:hypothetical protein